MAQPVLTAQRTLSLPWGSEEISVSLPETWRVAGILQPASLAPAPDARAEVRRSLAEPVGCARLRDLARPGLRVAVVVDDGSRPTPVSLVLPAVISELAAGGVCREDITLVTALGLHRPMTADELSARAGQPVSGASGTAGEMGRHQMALQWENHAPDDPDRLAGLGTTSRGTPVYVNKTVAGADLVVSIGCIEPHYIASFGGGYKNLVPGVAGRPTIAHNHSLNCTPSTFNMTGQPIEQNPMRLDLEEAAGMIKPPVFIANSVLNSRLELVRCVAGDPIAAHRAGARVSAELYGVKMPVAAPGADVVITDSHPMDSDFRQGVKGLGNTVRAMRPGGVQITLIRAVEGVGVFGLANRKLPVGRRGLKALAPLLVRIVPRLKLKGMGEEDRFFLYGALQMMRRGTLLIYGPTIPAATRAALPFVQFVDSPEEAIALAQRRVPRDAQVVVFPHGGTTYPVFA